MCPRPHPPAPQGLLVQMYPQLQITTMLRACREDRDSRQLLHRASTFWSDSAPTLEPFLPTQALYPGPQVLLHYLELAVLEWKPLNSLPDPEAI